MQPGYPPPGQFSPQPYGYGPPPGGWDQRPDRSATILVLSVTSFMVLFLACMLCGPFSILSLALSIPAIVMARRDLAAMDAGELSPVGRSNTHTGLILAWVSTALSGIIALIMLAIVVLYGGIIAAAILSQPPT